MLKMLVQELLTEDQILQGVVQPEEVEYKVLASEYLTGKQVILCMAAVVDEPGWQILDLMDAEGRGLSKFNATHTQSTTKVRTEKSALISNGKNTLQLLDWVEKDIVQRHDPIIRVIGPDAFEIADYFCGKMLDVLSGHLLKIEMDETVAKDIAGLTGRSLDEIMSVKTDIEATAKSMVESVTG